MRRSLCSIGIVLITAAVLIVFASPALFAQSDDDGGVVIDGGQPPTPLQISIWPLPMRPNAALAAYHSGETINAVILGTNKTPVLSNPDKPRIYVKKSGTTTETELLYTSYYGSGGYQCTNIDTSSLEEGLYVARGWAKDPATYNVATCGPINYFYIDNTSPILTMESNPSGWLEASVNQVSITFNATDNLEISQYEIAIDGGSYSTATSPYVINFSSMGWSGDFEHIVHVKAMDCAGNYSNVSDVVVHRDLTAPSQPTNVAMSHIIPTSRNIHATWNASTDASGIKNYYYQFWYTINSEGPYALSDLMLTTNTSATLDLGDYLSVDPTIQIGVRVWASDNADNVSIYTDSTGVSCQKAQVGYMY